MQDSTDSAQEKFYYIRDLFSALKEKNLSSNKMWLLREERRGKIKLRRDPSGRRRLTEKDIKDIINTYSPGGTGYWSFDGSLGPHNDL